MSGIHANRPAEGKSDHTALPGAASERSAFSRQAVSRSVIKTVSQKPYVLYPLSIGVLALLSALLLGPDALSVIAAILGVGGGAAAWLIDYKLRGELHASRYLSQLHASLADQRQQFIRRLEHDLQELGFIDGLSQLNRLHEKYTAFDTLLKRKLDPGEITYSRYLGMAEQVYLSSLDNLQRAVHVQQGTGAINESYTRRRLNELERIAEPNTVQRQELEALHARIELKQAQSGKVEEWLAQNEQAMTQLDLTSAAIAEMDTVRGQAGMDLESAMAELQRLAARSSAYDHQASN